jgi:hypothetical protein
MIFITKSDKTTSYEIFKDERDYALKLEEHTKGSRQKKNSSCRRRRN